RVLGSVDQVNARMARILADRKLVAQLRGLPDEERLRRIAKLLGGSEEQAVQLARRLEPGSLAPSATAGPSGLLTERLQMVARRTTDRVPTAAERQEILTALENELRSSRVVTR